jgi:GNAT superfamily N-acetyltransferase
MSSREITYQVGLPEQFRSEAISLFDEVFGCEFPIAVPCDKKRRLLLERCFMHQYTIVALSEGITYAELLSLLGFAKGNLAALTFSLYGRKPILQTLVMGGIAVHADFRGKGVGSRLLEEVANYAKVHKYNYVRLDVMDLNPKAMKLYKRKGFETVNSGYITYLRWILGFSGSTTMELCLQTKA